MRRRDRRSRRTWEGLELRADVRALLATELVSVLAWALTGEGLALAVALVAGLGLVVVALGTEDQPPHQRRVR